jgi:ABC-type multidrug transport system fused ATPase/permease subunit
LDSETERHIQQAFTKLQQGRTTLSIAHRLSTIIDCDMIYVLKNGEIIEQGTHKQLLAKQGEYYNLYEEQKK